MWKRSWSNSNESLTIGMLYAMKYITDVESLSKFKTILKDYIRLNYANLKILFNVSTIVKGELYPKIKVIMCVRVFLPRHQTCTF